MTAKTTPTADDAETGLRLLLRVSSDYAAGVGLTGVPARQFQAVLAIHLLASVMVDAGLTDDKWICGPRAPGRRDRARLRAFFVTYALLKRITAPIRRTSADSRFISLELFAPSPG